MDEKAFWQLMDDCRDSAPDPDALRLAAALTAHLRTGPVTMVVNFAEHLSWALYRLDRQEYGEDMSVDSFLYTRAAVVADGRETYEKVLRDPALFVPYATNDVWAEELLYVPDRVYQHLTGEEWDRSTRYSYESYSNTAVWD